MGNNDATVVIDAMMLTVNQAMIAATDKMHWRNLPPNTLPETAKQIVWTAKDLGLDVQFVDTDTVGELPCHLVRKGRTHALRVRSGAGTDKRYQARLYWSILLSIAEYLVVTLPSIADTLKHSDSPKRDKELFFSVFYLLGAA